ncbi:NAD(P)/FAD-dependent oxidoreductase [Marinivivus vitaminiproducens]|uniref:NAD(P)/FAD-dependent oxidoreductase n=1 Tax=Marinivivus vitaminiproducens TaxID=3035935 RepID=UPI0027A16A18|nr:FAD-dependent oxidoreductase [Geminicoccaceae bacterium SCSIO 64248]
MSETKDRAPVVVIGAGIVGIASACYLQRDGHPVVVLTADAPGEATSFGNAGCLNGSSVVPVSMPGVLSSVPGWLLDPEGPLVIRWRYMPTLLPWLVRFIRAGRPDRVAQQAKALRALLAPSIESYMPLVKEAHAEDLIHRRGHLFAYRSEASYAKDDTAMQLRRDNGVVVDDLSTDELRQLEPNLSHDYVRGRLVSENGHVGNPLRLTQSLAETLERNGGTIRRERAVGFVTENGRVTGVRTEAGVQPASAIVVAAGAWSKPLARELGDDLPLDTERGYHVVIADPDKGPRIPTMSAEDKIVATPMETGLRVAGTVEFAGLEAPPDWRRAATILKQALAMYPGLGTDLPEERLSRWMGFRPSMPDSLPVIGSSSRYPNAFYAFGHGHVGLAGGSMTGRLVAALVGHRPPPVDPSPFGASRFRRRHEK